jgi:deoxyribodipyrimidine photolyase-related protein
MRTYRDELSKAGHKVFYDEFSEESFAKRLETFLKKNKIEKVIVPEIQDKFFETELMGLFNKLKLSVEILSSPMFLSSRENFKNYLSKTKKPFMKTFYEGERKRLKILIDKQNRPEGGQWSYDVENRKKAPKVLQCELPPKQELNAHVKDISTLVDRVFSAHPGDSQKFWLPIDREGALHQLRHFIRHHLQDFGDYQDAITNRSPFLYHSVISPAMNAGLITPEEVVEEVLKARKKDSDIPLASVEGFTRQVIGWREFVRGIYQNFSEEEEKRNFFKHNRKLSKHWYNGTTGLPPVDDAIKKAIDYGYCHHIERLMILSNVMLISEVHPHEVHRWFMEMFVDSADWVMGPNVYGMGQFSDGGIFATKPYFSGSNYILKMSDYKKGDWCDVWDGLFWRFIDNHKAFFMKNHRLNMMVKTLEKMEPGRKKSLFLAAEEFIQTKTK